jgi:putative spermidine/putrescine transport system ATP-binding protein
MTPVVQLDGVCKEFDGTVVVRDVDLRATGGQLVALLGPSGCGKTTILRMIAGYLPATSGRVFLNGTDATRVPPERRNIGMVFQSYALFPHMTVAKNVAFGLRMRRSPAAEIRARVAAALELVGLAELAGRKPATLSGGQQQRVALARAIVVRPSLLLLDEPMSNLDTRLRLGMRQELRRIQRETGITSILVTHDQEEALELADVVVVLDGGRVVQQGPPREVFHAPANRFVADFFGYENFLDLPDRGPVTVRPEHIGVDATGNVTAEGIVPLSGVVTAVRFRGTACQLTVDVDGQQVRAVTTDETISPGQRVRLSVPTASVVALEAGADNPNHAPDLLRGQEIR